jgi:hypothetical protein
MAAMPARREIPKLQASQQTPGKRPGDYQYCVIKQ